MKDKKKIKKRKYTTDELMIGALIFNGLMQIPSFAKMIDEGLKPCIHTAINSESKKA